MRVLRLDAGDKRIGLALSDPAHALARVLKVHTGATARKDLEELRKIVIYYDVGEMAVGLPKDLPGP